MFCAAQCGAIFYVIRKKEERLKSSLSRRNIEEDPLRMNPLFMSADDLLQVNGVEMVTRGLSNRSDTMGSAILDLGTLEDNVFHSNQIADPPVRDGRTGSVIIDMDNMTVPSSEAVQANNNEQTTFHHTVTISKIPWREFQMSYLTQKKKSTSCLPSQPTTRPYSYHLSISI